MYFHFPGLIIDTSVLYMDITFRRLYIIYGQYGGWKFILAYFTERATDCTVEPPNGLRVLCPLLTCIFSLAHLVWTDEALHM